MKIIKVYGDDDYATLQFDDEFKAKDIIKQMEDESITVMTLISKDETEIHVKLMEFNTPDELFEYYKNDMQDYDDSKHTNYYRR